MSVLVACLLLGSPPLQTPELPAWSEALARVASHLGAFRLDKAKPRMTLDRLTRVFGAAGLRARYDESTHRQIPGLFVERWSQLVPIVGAKDGFVVFVSRVDSQAKFRWDDTATALFIRRDGAWRGQLVEKHGDDNGVMPECAAIVGDHLLVAGLREWMGNSARVSVRSYQSAAGGWSLVGSKVSKDESWDVPRLRLSPDGKSIQPVQITSRTYPEHLSSCHATANLSYVEEWSFTQWKPSLKWRRLRSTAFNTLDTLYEAISSGDQATLLKHSATPEMARRLKALGSKAASGVPAVVYPNSRSSTEYTTIGVENLGVMFHFVLRRGVWVVARLESTSGSAS